MSGLLAGGSGAVPTYTPATGTASGPSFGTGYTKTTGYTAAPSSITYDDPYLGGRAPEYINWSFGLQRQVTNAMAITATYVGSEGHFLQLDSYNARGYWPMRSTRSICTSDRTWPTREALPRRSPRIAQHTPWLARV